MKLNDFAVSIIVISSSLVKLYIYIILQNKNKYSVILLY